MVKVLLRSSVQTTKKPLLAAFQFPVSIIFIISGEAGEL